MADWKTKLKNEFDENPLNVIGVGALAATAFAKIIDSVAGARSKRAYAKMVKKALKKSR